MIPGAAGQKAGGAVLPPNVVCVGVASVGSGEDLRVAAAFGDLDAGTTVVVARSASTDAVIAGAGSIPDGIEMGGSEAAVCVQAVEAWASTAWTMEQAGVPTGQWLPDLNARLGVTSISPAVDKALTSGLRASVANPDPRATVGLTVGSLPPRITPAPPPPAVDPSAGLGMV